jgi:prepilin-type N-terminal cleavage/methylation domain-containing protein
MTKTTHERGMTLVETLVAVSILAVAIVAPMTLTMQSLSAAYYARDQVIASNLAQEALEAVRAIRDANILTLALNAGATCPNDGLPMHLLCSIPIGQDFIVDARIDPPEITTCPGACPKLKTDNNLYGHESSWTIETPFQRTVRAEYVGGTQDEIRVTVTVTRETAVRTAPPVILHENLYRWVNDGSGE